MTGASRLLVAAWLQLAAIAVLACGPQEQTEGIEVLRAVATEPISGRAALYLTIKNHGPFGDVLDSVTTPVAGGSQLHETTREGGRSRMQRIGGVPLPVDSTIRLAPGGHHVMLMEVDPSVHPGDSVRATLFFRRYDTLSVAAPVVRHADVEAVLYDAQRDE